MSIAEFVAVALLAASPLAMTESTQQPKSTTREFVTVSGTIERLDKSTRTLTLRTASDTTQAIVVAPDVKVFDELKTGDKVTVRLSEAVIVAVRPGAKPSLPANVTPGAASSDPSGKSEVLYQVKATVTIESVDRNQNLVAYKTADNLRLTRVVGEPRLLDGLKAGDVVEITYTRERAVDVQRAR